MPATQLFDKIHFPDNQRVVHQQKEVSFHPIVLPIPLTTIDRTLLRI